MTLENTPAATQQIADIAAAMSLLNADIDDATQSFDTLSIEEVLAFVEEHHLTHLLVGAGYVTGWLFDFSTDKDCLILTDRSFIEICVGTEGRQRVMYTVYPFEMTNETFTPFKSTMGVGSADFNESDEFQICGWCDEYITYGGRTATLYINRDYGAFHTDVSVNIVAD